MRTGFLTAFLVFLAGVLPMAGAQAAGSGKAICQGDYPMLLMTAKECRGYLRELRTAQAKSDHMAALDLQEWHTELLIERSQACPCRPTSASMRMISNSQSQSAYLIRN